MKIRRKIEINARTKFLQVTAYVDRLTYGHVNNASWTHVLPLIKIYIHTYVYILILWSKMSLLYAVSFWSKLINTLWCSLQRQTILWACRNFRVSLTDNCESGYTYKHIYVSVYVYIIHTYIKKHTSVSYTYIYVYLF